jgi:hypothetical protein
MHEPAQQPAGPRLNLPNFFQSAGNGVAVTVRHSRAHDETIVVS